jgi:hypothetical protein
VLSSPPLRFTGHSGGSLSEHEVSCSCAADARRRKLKAGLAQLRVDQLQHILDYRAAGNVMVYDDWNFEVSTGRW